MHGESSQKVPTDPSPFENVENKVPPRVSARKHLCKFQTLNHHLPCHAEIRKLQVSIHLNISTSELNISCRNSEYGADQLCGFPQREVGLMIYRGIDCCLDHVDFAYIGIPAAECRPEFEAYVGTEDEVPERCLGGFAANVRLMDVIKAKRERADLSFSGLGMLPPRNDSSPVAFAWVEITERDG